MMSPLALLKEGEVAEIIDPPRNRPGTQHRHHRHGHDGCRCTTPCTGCSCRHAHHGGLAAHSHFHLQDMGLRPGKKVEMITNSGTGPLILRVDECRIAMGRGEAMKIYVRRDG
ncbi:MAG: ferrous iron transport protein A [Pseudomonadota bacterium]